jgi:glycosyltransferase involved in cell wall biosynthesis
VFPSYSEGFGWPVIEAMACGACVIASNHAAIMEVGAEAALYVDPDNVHQFASHFQDVLKADVQTQLRAKAKNNCLRFEKTQMINNYIELIK